MGDCHYSVGVREYTFYDYHLFGVGLVNIQESALHPDLRFFSFQQLQDAPNVTSSTKRIAEWLVGDRDVVVGVVTRLSTQGREFLLTYTPEHQYFFPSTRLRHDAYPAEEVVRVVQSDLGYEGAIEIVDQVQVDALQESTRFGQLETRFHFHLCLLNLPGTTLAEPGNPLEQSLAGVVSAMAEKRAEAAEPTYWRWCTEEEMRTRGDMSPSLASVIAYCPSAHGANNMNYNPTPIDTSLIVLPDNILELAEILARNTHEIWARQRLAEGWQYGSSRSDEKKETPCLVPYADLPECEKDYDRRTALETLKLMLALGYEIRPKQSVVWLPRAMIRIHDPDRLEMWNRELAATFGNGERVQIAVNDVFFGYSQDEANKIVLGVQLTFADRVVAHIVKLGNANKVRSDLDGWKKCILSHRVTSRLLVNVSGKEVGQDRYAAVYEDAYSLFGTTDPDTESPKPLELAAKWAIHDSSPDIRSVESCLVQIISELNRCLYQGASDRNPDRVAEFYTGELQQGGSQSAWERWQEKGGKYFDLRRDALWLTTAREKPDSPSLPGYLDPFDYLNWAFKQHRIPSTLVGRAHGDLHGRNILVVVCRGEVVQPAVFDYGDMSERNLPVWDFVKLELELKTRILPSLYHNSEAQRALQATCGRLRSPAVKGAGRLSPDEQEIASRVDRMEFAFLFETLLASLTREIVSRDAAAHARPPDKRNITGHAAIDKAICLILRLRQEAAHRLGYDRQRAEDWRNEYYFALATYGVLKAKWHVEQPQLEWALISAGVATTQLSDAHRSLRETAKCPCDVDDYVVPPSHLIRLRQAHICWREQRSDEGARLLEKTIEEFPAAVTLRAEFALCLSTLGRLDEAADQVVHLRRLCHVFCDYEMLSRLGRIYKDSGDRIWEADTERPDYRCFVASNHPARQLYSEAFELYREAFQFSRHYFPGINAATLALLTGRQDSQEELAQDVAKICRDMSLTDMEERFWVYSTQGEASLLANKPEESLRFYRAALATPSGTKLGMVQALYSQLCRLYWGLGAGPVQPIVDELQRVGILQKLEAGPFGNCGRHPS